MISRGSWLISWMEDSPSPPVRASILAPLRGEGARPLQLVGRVDVGEDHRGVVQARHVLLGNGEHAHLVPEARDLQFAGAKPARHGIEAAAPVAGVERFVVRPRARHTTSASGAREMTRRATAGERNGMSQATVKAASPGAAASPE